MPAISRVMKRWLHDYFKIDSINGYPRYKKQIWYNWQFAPA